ncbi:MAG TPA: hypothetical protein VI365_12350 [Trebonia sp.]
MRHRSILTVGLVMMAGFLVAGGIPALAASSPVGTWGTAQAAPDTSAANGGTVDGVSCAPHGECTAVLDAGLNTTNDLASYVVTERGGSWGPEVPIPGLTKIAPAGDTVATGLSCPKSGYCLVAGIYAYGTGDNSIGAFTIWESNGTWGTPAKIPGLSKLNTVGLAVPAQVACSSTRTCVISGIYAGGTRANPSLSTFIAQELYGKWKNAIQAPGLPKPSGNNAIAPDALSCPSQGNCVLGLGSPDLSVGVSVSTGSGPIPAAIRGEHRLTGQALLRSLAAIRPFTATAATATAATSSQQARAVIEIDGTWRKAQKVGPAVSASGLAAATAVACPATGKCVLAGVAAKSGSAGYSFFVTESGTTWSKPVQFATFGVLALACPAAGSCVAGGLDKKGVAAIMAEKRGKWGTPTELPSARDLSHGTAKAQGSEVDYLVCPSAGNCSVGGSYSWDANSDNPGEEVFVGGEANGGWAHVRVPAGIAALNTGLFAGFTGLSCASVANCAAGGDYLNTSDDPGAFIIAQTPAR